MIQSSAMTRFVLTVLVCLAASTSLAQSDESSFVFADSSIPVVRIEMSQINFDELFADGNQYSDVERLASFEFHRDGVSYRVDSVGFRLRGNTSRDAAKKSFKVSFNTFRPGAEFFDLEKMNLNGEHNDPSIMRAKLSWDLFNAMGLPASRANHVDLFINGSYFGLYLNVEHVDEKFLTRHYGNADGNLYKCLWPADLTFLGPDAEAYRPVGGTRSPYDLKLKDDDLQGYDDLAHFITVLNTVDESTFVSEIEKVFDVNGFLRAQAVTVLLGSWDSYWFLKNNYYLYFNPASDRFEYIPFDFDNVVGIWWDGIFPGLNWTSRDVYQWGHPTESRPLTERILAAEVFRDRYTFYLKELLNTVFSRQVLEPEVLALRDSITLSATNDPFRPMDYGFTMQDFQDSFFGALSNHPHVVDGILPFIEERALSAERQLESIDVKPIISDLTVSPSKARPGGEVTLRVRVEDESLDRVELHYWLGAPVEQIALLQRDPRSGKDMFTGSITAQSTTGFIDYIIEAYDQTGQRSATSLMTIEVGESVPLFINEFMASNVSTIRDPANEFDDWIELYNGGSTDLSLGGFFLTDTLGIPFKWSIPDTTIPAGGHIMVWADEDGTQGPMHANFRLARSGEVIAIYDSRGALIDSVSFGVQSSDVSFGRLPDGSSSFMPLASPTPGFANSSGVGTTPSSRLTNVVEITLFPNPFFGPLNVHFSRPVRKVEIEVFDVLGRRITRTATDHAGTTRFTWAGESSDGASLPAGVYLLRVRAQPVDGSPHSQSAIAVKIPG